MSRTGISTVRTAAQPIERVTTSFEGHESMTRQDQAEHVNINNIYRKTQLGQFPVGATKLPEYGDFSMTLTYDQALIRIKEAKDAFLQLPAEERKLYGHDPERYYAEKLSEANQELRAAEAAEMDAKNAKAHSQAVEAAEKLLATQNKE